MFPTTATAGLTQGNPDLQPETADTYNFGLSWTSRSSERLLSGLSASVDYYSIEIEDVISVVPGLSALSKCYNLDGSNPDVRGRQPVLPAADARRERPAAADRDAVPESRRAEDRGHRPAARLGRRSRTTGWTLRFNTGVGYLLDYSVQTLPGSAFQDFTGTNTIAANHTVSNTFPEWKALTTVGYGFGPVQRPRCAGGTRMRWTTSLRSRRRRRRASASTTYNLYDFFASYDFNDEWQMRLGVTNLTDEGPVTVSSSQTGTDTAVFDVLGRSYYMGVRVRM